MRHGYDTTNNNVCTTNISEQLRNKCGLRVYNVTLNENGNTAVFNWNGTNETMLGSGMNFYLTKTGFSTGIYSFRVYANDTSDNWNVSETRIVK